MRARTKSLLRAGQVIAAVACGAGLIVLHGTGCGLVLDFSAPPKVAAFDCSLVVRQTDPGMEMLERRVFSGGDMPWGFDTRRCGQNSAEAAGQDWRNYAAREIDRLRAAGDPEWQGDWCEVGELLNCAAVGVRNPCSSVSGPPLPACPVTPAEACCELQCAGAPCSGPLEYRDVLVGSADPRPITITNVCADAVFVKIDEMIVPVGPAADFDVPAATNGCRLRASDDPEMGRRLPPSSESPIESSCGFEIVFRPREPGAHLATYAYSSSCEPLREITLRGFGIGGSTGFGVDGTVDPARVCFDTLLDTCTNRRRIEVRNDGPGELAVRDIRLEPDSGDFVIGSIEAPDGTRYSPGTAPEIRLAAGESLLVDVAWCTGGAGERTAQLIVDTNQELRPTHELTLIYQPTGCPPGT